MLPCRSSAPAAFTSGRSGKRRTSPTRNGSATASGRYTKSDSGATSVIATRSSASARRASVASSAATPPPAIRTSTRLASRSITWLPPVGAVLLLPVAQQERNKRINLLARELAPVAGRHHARLVPGCDRRVRIEDRLAHEGPALSRQRCVEVRADRRLRAGGGQRVTGAAAGREEDALAASHPHLPAQ